MASMRQKGASMRTVARMLGRSASNISREFERNTRPAPAYASHTAQLACHGRRQAARVAKLCVQSVARSLVLTLNDWRWSTQQSALTLKRVFPDEPERHVSHETIYTAIFAQPRGEMRRQLISCPRQGRSIRMPRSHGIEFDCHAAAPEPHLRPGQGNVALRGSDRTDCRKDVLLRPAQPLAAWYL